MKIWLLILLVLLVILLSAILIIYNRSPQTPPEPSATEHIYVSWDNMELDKCVAAWLIVRFLDKDARFLFYPQGTELKHGIPFDIPGAAWSRKHRMCTSDCILQSLGLSDPAIKKIVEIAHHTELNYWQLDEFPLAKKCLDHVQRIFADTPDHLQCLEKTSVYFDKLYAEFRDPNSFTR